MHFYSNVFAKLASQVRHGDLQARQRFQQELESVMVLMVRQILRGGAGATSIARRILAMARRLRAGGHDMVDDSDDFVRQVAHKVCDEVVARLQPCPDGLAADESIHSVGFGSTVLAG
jgi:hypothetical protein